jgi:hypothetical protein
MSTFLFLYYHHKDRPPTASPETIAASGAFFKAIEPNLEDMGNPIFTRTTIGECGESTVLGGYSFVSADSLGEALALAKDVWLLQRGGGVEIGEVTLLNPDGLATTFADHPAAASTAA